MQHLPLGPDGWLTPPAYSGTSSAHPTPPRPEILGHASGTAGAVCPDGEADLVLLEGTRLRLNWHERGVEHEQVFSIERVRGALRIYADALSSDGLLRLEWER